MLKRNQKKKKKPNNNQEEKGVYLSIFWDINIFPRMSLKIKKTCPRSDSW